MVLSPFVAGLPFPVPYAGPRDDDPLTEAELSLLLAIPRAAKSTPSATLFRLPLGPDPALGWVDVTCAETYSVVSRLAAVWRDRLSELLDERTDGIVTESKVGPGTTVCILSCPPVNTLFHLFAFWALGCTVQFFSTGVKEEVVDSNLRQSGCKVVLHSGMGDAWIEGREAHFEGKVVRLAEDEYAHRLAQAEKENTQPAPSWPEPRRPTPMVIIQSSGTTGAPKILRFSLYFYTLGHAFNCRSYLALAHPHNYKTKTPYTHPRLTFSYPFWQSFYPILFIHLGTATPLAFPHIPDTSKFTSEQLIAWAQKMDAGGISCTTSYLREIPPSLLQAHIEFFQSLYSITIAGSLVDDRLSDLLTENKLSVTNILGMSELERLLVAPRAPFTHLRPFPDAPPPLVHPISDPNPDGSRHVQLWSSISTSPILAHLIARGGVPLKLEPFPGEGPHHGEPAFNWGDVFLEVNTPLGETAYVHLGRADDRILLSRSVRDNISASVYENELFSRLCSGSVPSSGWVPDKVQLFGSNMECTSMVVQLRGSGQGETRDLEDNTLQEISKTVEEVNSQLKLGPNERVHPQKRLLVVTLDDDTYTAYGPNGERAHAEQLQLLVTHKRTLQRWKNTQIFRPWLDVLDFSDP